jgi:HK97 family phage portal protein
MRIMDRMKAAYHAMTAPPPPEQRVLTLSDFTGLAPFLDSAINQGAGVNVTERTAMNASALWCGVNLISSQIATLPRAVYKRMSDDERVRDRSVPAAKVLMSPNEHMTDVVFWETLVAHALTWGGGVAEIEFDNALRPKAMWPITPDRVSIRIVANDRLQYWIDGGRTILEAEDVIHIPGATFNGVTGYSVVQMARASIGLSIAAERFGGQFFGNGARPGIALEHPKTLSAPAQERLKASFVAEHGGSRQLGVAVLEEGMQLKTYSIPPNDAQFLETRVFQVEEIARWLNISPSKLKSKIGERPGGNLEQDQLNFLTDTLRPWLIRIEQELNRKLFPASQRSTYYVEHIVDALLRTDSTARMASYKSLYDMKVITAAQIARMENLPEPPDPKATGPATAPQPPAPTPDPPPAAEEPTQPRNGRSIEPELRQVLLDSSARFVRRECAEARKAAKKGPQAFQSWIQEFYEGRGHALWESITLGVALHMAQAGIAGDPRVVSEGLAGDYLAQSRDAWEALKASNLEQGVEALALRWLSLRPAEMAEAIAGIKETSNAA